MYRAMFEPNLTRYFDSLTIMKSSDVNRVNKQEIYGGADINADRVMREELARKNTPAPEPTPTYTYTPLTQEPLDWSTSYVTYYQKKTGTDEYELIPAGTGAPTFEVNKYYSRSEA